MDELSNRATLSDVAREAGVSMATVDRVLNKRPGVHAKSVGRVTDAVQRLNYRPDPAGGLELADAPGGQWSHRPAFPAGSGGLCGTVDDWFRFAQMILGEGIGNGRRLLSPESVRQMTTNHLTQPQREIGELFLEGQGWGFGASVDVEAIDPLSFPLLISPILFSTILPRSGRL